MHEHNSNRARSAHLHKITPITENPLLTEVVELWALFRMPSAKSIKTVHGVVRQFTLATGIEHLDDINSNTIFIEWRGYLMNVREVKPATWNNYLKHMRMLLKFAEEMGWGGIQALTGVRTMPEHQHGFKCVNKDKLGAVVRWLEVEQNYNVNPGWFWVCAIKVLFFTGIRRRQIVGLTWADIDTRNMQIKLVAHHSKTKRAYSIPLHPELLPVFEELREQAEFKLRQRMRPEDQVFNANLYYARSSPDKAMTEEQLSSGFKRIQKHTKVLISPHRFRHTFCTDLANSNGGEINMKNVQSLMGHTNLGTTMGYVRPDMGVSNLIGGLRHGF